MLICDESFFMTDFCVDFGVMDYHNMKYSDAVVIVVETFCVTQEEWENLTPSDLFLLNICIIKLFSMIFFLLHELSGKKALKKFDCFSLLPITVLLSLH